MLDFDDIRYLVTEDSLKEALMNTLVMDDAEVEEWVRQTDALVDNDEFDKYKEICKDAIQHYWEDDEENLKEALKDLDSCKDSSDIIDVLTEYDLYIDLHPYYSSALESTIEDMSYQDKVSILGLDRLNGKELIDKCVSLDLIDPDDLEEID